MSKKFKPFFYLLSLTFFIVLFACQKEVEIDLPPHKPKIVVEAWIEKDEYAYVSITRNSPYFSKVDSASLANLIILNANVYLSNGVITEKLEIDYSNINFDVWPFIKYKSQTIKGEVGKTYNLTIFTDDDTIKGQTTITNPVFMDSIWWQADNIGKPQNDSLGYIWATYTDNPNKQENIRIFTKRHNIDKSFIPIWGSVYDDSYISGKTITFTFYRGIPSFTDVESINNDKELFYFKKGDSVTVKISSMDRSHFDFWKTIEQENFSGGNPFMYPTVIRHNVVGGIGVFGGYNSVYYTFKIGENNIQVTN